MILGMRGVNCLCVCGGESEEIDVFEIWLW